MVRESGSDSSDMFILQVTRKHKQSPDTMPKSAHVLHSRSSSLSSPLFRHG